ncbi:MAG: glutaredoxin family protein [Acidobacteriota bacterium]|nr:glutaredoxin family protein [Acidobacteriota bacterium]
MSEIKIKVYGADWCSMTTRTIEHLEEVGAPFEYVDVDEDEAAAQWVKDQNGGKEKKPTVDLGGKVLTEPSNAELDVALKAAGLL